MKTILILDANSLFNRAFYGVRPLTTSTGLPTNAVFGYINILQKHLDAVKPDFAVAAFDVHAPTFRHRYDAAYKATRKPMPEELRAQMPYLKRATAAMGIAIVEKEGFEADDILGTLSRLAEESGNRAVLVTGDRDSYQLVSENVTLMLAGTHKDEEITPSVIKEKFGLEPKDMIQVKALAGDSSDNISGVRGIGEKTALKLITERKTLDGIYADTNSLPLGPSAKEKIVAGKDDAYRSLYLATICREIPDLVSIESYPYEGPVLSEMKPLLTELEFFKMLSKFDLPEEKKEVPAADPLQGSIFDSAPISEEVIEEIDVAELDPKAQSFLVFDEEKFYLLQNGTVHSLGGDVGAFLKEASPVVCDYKAYLHRFFASFGSFLGVKVAFDLFLASYVINSQDSAMTLSRLVLIYLKESAPLNVEQSPAAKLRLMERLYPVLSQSLAASSAKELYETIELPLAYVLAKMEEVGFRVDGEGLQEYGNKIKSAMTELQGQIWDLAGEEFNLNSPKQLGVILFEKLSLPAGKKTKTGYATDAETLSKLRFHSPIIDLILSYRTLSKLYSTYVVGLSEQIREDGRIHTVFHQMVTATGRLSSAEPNLQNIPVRTELGSHLRRFFTAKEGSLLVDADYSQIELRLLAHISGDEMMQRYFLDGGDIHTKTASEIFHVKPEEVTPQMRKSAKAVNFGIVYGIGEYSLSQDLGVPLRVAKDYINQYFALFPGIRSYWDGIKAKAHEEGQVSTLFGRVRKIPELKGPKKPLIAFGERVAMNTPIQGTAADIIKLAMVRVDRRLEEEGLRSRLILQVHDELILEAPEAEAETAARILSEEMEGAVSYSVPLTAESKTGFTWYDAK